MAGVIAVGVSGAGSNLRAIADAIRTGSLDARIGLVFADRPCAALDWATEQGIDTALIPAPRLSDLRARGAWDTVLAETLTAVGPRVVVLAGFMRILGGPVLEAFPNRVVNTHPALSPSFPGADAVRDALAGGVAVTGITVHLVTDLLDGGPILLQEAVPVLPRDDRAALQDRIKAVEHRLLPRAVGLLLAGAVRTDGTRATIDHALAEAALPRPRRALLATWDKSELVPFATGLVELGFELVSTGGTAAALRDAGLPVTDVAAVTGFPEMLDGRVKTLHPRIHGGILADLGRASHRLALEEAGIAPFELVVVNLYPFARVAHEAGTGLDELVEMIDIGGPAMVRAAAKNHGSVGVVVEPAAYPDVLAELRAAGLLSETTRRALAVRAFAITARYDRTVEDELGRRFAVEAPRTSTLELTEVATLRYGENPHQGAWLSVLPNAQPGTGPFAGGGVQLQGKPLSYNNILDASAAAGLARDLHGPAVVIVKHTNPCGAAERPDLLDAWEAALAGDRVSAFGGVVALTRPVDVAVAQRLASIFLEVVVAPSIVEAARPVLAARENLRVVIDPEIDRPAPPSIEYRSAGGAVLATDSDTAPDDPSTWVVATVRGPTDAERRDLDLAWRVARHVKSNAIVLVRDGAVVGVGAGQMSRVDSARIAVEKAGPERARGAVCASDAFYPFPDALEACAVAGVTAFVQPGGSMRDQEVIAAADRAGAAMLLTGVRHFRH